MKFVFALAGLAGVAFLTGCGSTHYARTEAPIPTQGAAASQQLYYTEPAMGATGEATTTTEGTVVYPTPVYTERVHPENAWPDWRLNSAYRGYENHSDDWSQKYMAP
jgi:hypothetical protein